MPDEDTLTPKEVAEALSCTRRTIYRWIHSGKLATTKVDGRHRISAEQLTEAVGWKKAADVFTAQGKKPEFNDSRDVLASIRAANARISKMGAELAASLSTVQFPGKELNAFLARAAAALTAARFPWPPWAYKTKRNRSLYACWAVLENPHDESKVDLIHEQVKPEGMTQKDMFEAAALLLGDTRVALDRRLRRAVGRGMVHIRAPDGSLKRVTEWPGPDVSDWRRFLAAWVRTKSRSY